GPGCRPISWLFGGPPPQPSAPAPPGGWGPSSPPSAARTATATSAIPSARASISSRRKSSPTSRPSSGRPAGAGGVHGILRRGGVAFMTRAFVMVASAFALVIGSAASAWAGAPTDQVREYTDAVVRVLADPAVKAEDKKLERRAAVRKIAAEVFDVQETARRALGPHWQQRTPQERQEFVQLFNELLEQTYISKIDLFGGERLKFTDEKVD